MIDKLTNCPQCGGILNEAGRCEFCGSKVYDFLTIDFSNTQYISAKTYIRVKYKGKIVIAPVIVNSMRMDMESSLDTSYFEGSPYYLNSPCYPRYNIDFDVVGDMIEVAE